MKTKKLKAKYIHELKAWPEFRWNQERLAERLAILHHHQGRLIGKMSALGFSLRAEARLQSLTEEVIKSSEIEGEFLDRTQVRSSLARRLGMDVKGLTPAMRNVEGVVEMMLDATQKFDAPLTVERLFGWHSASFAAEKSSMSKIRVGHWRDDREGPMRVISGAIGREKIHFQAPAAVRLNREMRAFLDWFNNRGLHHQTKPMNSILKAGVAHLWFVTIHPFDDGNGRIGRAITDMSLARSESSQERFYSMSAQICQERKAYYDILETTQKADLDITPWLEWFLGCLSRAFESSEAILASVLAKASFWKIHGDESFNDRQRKMINRLLDGFEGKLTSSKWAILCKSSQDSASRDLEDLVKRKILMKNPGGGRSTSYSLAPIVEE